MDTEPEAPRARAWSTRHTRNLAKLAAWTPHKMDPAALLLYDDALGKALTLSEAQLGAPSIR
jgi:hypothetical protein